MAQIILDSNSNLIQGDFDTATLSQRTRLQTSTVNATTGVYVVPNGSATSASVQVSNAADPTNASKVVVATNGSTDTQIVSGANGSGTYLPLSFYTNNDIRFQMGTAGELNVRTAPGTVSSGTSGQFLTSNGPGAGVSWTTAPTPPSPQFQTEVFTAPGTWTKPASCTQVRVTVIGGGGGGGPGGPTGGGGGAAIVIVPVSAPVAVTVGAGGPSSASGGTSSFGPSVSCTGGAGNSPTGTPGSVTVSPGLTRIYTGHLGTNSGVVSNSNRWNGLSLGVVRGSDKSNQGFGNGGTSGFTYSTSAAGGMAGTGGSSSSGSPPFSEGAGVGGVVVVEFVG